MSAINKMENKSKLNKVKKILITGSSGMIGTRLFEKLLGKGYKVTGFDRKSNKYHPELDKLTIIGDLLNKEDFIKVSSDFDLIVHLAANARVYDLVVEPDLALENIISTYNILEFARKNRIKSFIFSSSRETYGNRKKTVAREEDVNMQLCESPYSASKISDETLVYSFSKCYGIDYIVCRFSNVYGMYDGSDRFIPAIIKKMAKNEDIEIYGKDKVLDFTYIDDCIDGLEKCINNFKKAKNNVFNIASGKGNKLIDVAEIMRQELHSTSKIKIGKNRTGEVVKFIANISKSKRILDYSPKYSIEKGVKFSVEWYLKNNL